MKIMFKATVDGSLPISAEAEVESDSVESDVKDHISEVDPEIERPLIEVHDWEELN